MAAFAGSADAVLGGGGVGTLARVGKSAGVANGGVGGDRDTTSVALSERGAQGGHFTSGSVGAAARAHALQQSQNQSPVRPTMSSSQPLSEEAWGGDSNISAFKEEGGGVETRPSDDLVDTLFSSVDGTDKQDGGFLTGSSIPTEGAIGGRSTGSGGRGGESGDPGTAGKRVESPQPGEHRRCGNNRLFFYLLLTR